MDAPPPVHRSKHIRWIYNILVVGMLLAGMTLPLYRFNSPGTEDSIKKLEYRTAKPLPVLQQKDLGRINLPTKSMLEEFRQAWAGWFSDHLGFRREMIQGYAVCRYLGIVPSNIAGLATEQPNVQVTLALTGSDGRLFYNAERILEDFRCTAPFTPEELSHWKSVFETRYRWFADRGIPYVLMIPPNAQTIYPECMPAGLKRTRNESRLDQLLQALKTVPGFQVVDVRQDLIQGKSQHSTYHKTDTHWNDFGAFLGYQGLVRKIAKNANFKDLQPLPLSNYQIIEQDIKTSTKDLARMLNLPFDLNEHLVSLRPKHPSTLVRTKLHPPQGYESSESIQCPGALYSSALVIHDSFFEAMKRWFGTHFQNSTYILSRISFPYAEMEKLRPEIVVEEIVERRLMAPLPPNPSNMQTLSPGLLASQPTEPQTTRR